MLGPRVDQSETHLDLKSDEGRLEVLTRDRKNGEYKTKDICLGSVLLAAGTLRGSFCCN